MLIEEMKAKSKDLMSRAIAVEGLIATRERLWNSDAFENGDACRTIDSAIYKLLGDCPSGIVELARYRKTLQGFRPCRNVYEAYKELLELGEPVAKEFPSLWEEAERYCEEYREKNETREDEECQRLKF